MTYIRAGIWPWALAAYTAGGLAIGLALPWFKAFASSHWGRPGIAVAIVINLAMPLLVVAVAAAYPRAWVALVGTLIASAAFIMLGSRAWPPSNLSGLSGALRSLPPVLVVALLAYHALAVGTTFSVSPWRRVGAPPHPMACQTCGYLLIGMTEPRCPECGEPFDPSRLDQVAR